MNAKRWNERVRKENCGVRGKEIFPKMEGVGAATRSQIKRSTIPFPSLAARVLSPIAGWKPAPQNPLFGGKGCLKLDVGGCIEIR
jgi:hypothetical protein